MERFPPAMLDVWGAEWESASSFSMAPSARRYESYEMSFAAKVNALASRPRGWREACHFYFHFLGFWPAACCVSVDACQVHRMTLASRALGC